MKKSIYILILFAGIFLLNASGLHAQKRYVFEKKITTESNTLNYKLSGKQYYNKIIPSGTVFLFDEWKKGYVTLVNGDRYDDVSLKYDIFSDELIEINNRTVTMIMLDKNTISEFGFYNSEDGDSMVFVKTHFEKNPEEEHYFQLLYSGSLKFLIQHRSFEEETTLYKDQYGYLRNTIFNHEATYYLVFPGNRFEKFKLKRWSFIDLFSDNKERKKEVRRLLHQNRISVQTNQDAIRAVKLVEERFYNISNESASQ